MHCVPWFADVSSFVFRNLIEIDIGPELEEEGTKHIRYIITTTTTTTATTTIDARCLLVLYEREKEAAHSFKLIGQTELSRCASLLSVYLCVRTLARQDISRPRLA